MRNRCGIFIFLWLTGFVAFGQIWPQPGAALNYTQIMFEHPPIHGAAQYIIEIAFDEPGQLFQNPVAMHKDAAPATIMTGLQFGKNYVWRYGAVNDKQVEWHGPYSFKILNDPHVDPHFYRARVLVNDSLENSGGLITLDNERAIIDRAGNFVWFLPPDSGGHKIPSKQRLPDNMVSDLQITPAGTITVINHFNAQESDLAGHMLWHAPWTSTQAVSPGSIGAPNLYNHCLQKLTSGNYMVIEGQKIAKPAPGSNGPEHNPTDTPAKIMVATEVIREFDKKGNLTWSWNSSGYFDSLEVKDIAQSKVDSFLLDPTPGGHMNAFYTDEKNGFIYVGFRNVSRVIKIDKKTEAVVCSWGEKMKFNNQPNGDGFFSKQHDTKLLHDGTLAVFNNDLRGVNMNDFGHRASSVVIFTQPSQHKNSEIIWRFECRLDSGNNLSSRGGSVDEMKNGNLLVGMGTVNKVFEITRDKKIVWSAVIERFNPVDGRWSPCPLYRNHYASSLYPCYFAIQTNSDTLHKGSSPITLKIFNCGTEPDAYLVNITSLSGNYKEPHATTEIAPGKSTNFEIAPNKNMSSGDAIEITVQSKTNPDFKRTVEVHYIK